MVCLVILLGIFHDVLLVEHLHHLVTVCELGSAMLACTHTACRACTESSSNVTLCRQPAWR